MEKLLHEQLREFEEGMIIGTCSNVLKIVDMKCSNYDGCNSCIMELFSRLADEIERYYIPRPRDNKGIPYHKGDKIWSIDPDTEFSAEVVGVNVNTLYICWEDGLYDLADPCEMQHEKPQPKVLDADGVEIKVGDTVYLVNGSDISYTVEELHPEEKRITVVNEDVGTVGFRTKRLAESYTHEKPVLDADGIHIRVGDIVYGLEIDGERGRVRALRDYGAIVDWDAGYRSDGVAFENLTHKEQDSLEKLRDDIADWGFSKHDEASQRTTQAFIDRLSALIERGA